MTDWTSWILPEVAVRRNDSWGYPLRNREAPVFPDACPRCGAAVASRGTYYNRPVAYACGAAYDAKPQIQNHTDKWWGTCPLTKARVQAERAAPAPAAE